MLGVAGIAALMLLLFSGAMQTDAGQAVDPEDGGPEYRLDPIPPGGNCVRVGWKYHRNPFSGWPIEQHVCERIVIPWGYCDERHPTQFPHWGVDFAYPGIEGANVLSTTDHAIVGRMHDEGRWNGGMGNYVELRALDCLQERMRTRCQDGACESILEPMPVLDVASHVSHMEHTEICRETGWVATYMHLKAVAVTVGQRVARGDVIGSVGAVGNASGFHLHYEITSPYDKPGGAIDPMPTLCDGWIE